MIIDNFLNNSLKTSHFYRACCFISILLFFALSAYAETFPKEPHISLADAEQNWLNQKHTVRVRVGNWPPFMFSEGDFKGISIDYIEKIFGRHGINYQFFSDKQFPWKTALEHIKNHQEIDLLLTAKITDERKKYIAFTDEYLFLPWVIFSRTDFPFIGGIDDLAGKTVCVPDGYVMHDLLTKNYPKINLQVISGANLEPRCIKALALGDVDAYVGNLAVGSYIIQSKGYNNVKVVAPTPASFGNHNHAMAIRNDWPELTTIINKTLNSFTPEEHSEIRNKWLSVRYEHGIRPMDVLKWVLAVASVLIAILSIILFWNRRLNQEISERQKVEEKLRVSENKYRGLSDAAFEGIAISKQGRLIEVNNLLAKMLGYKTEELIGKAGIELVSPEERDNVTSKMSAGYELQYESICLRKDGSTFPVEIQAKMYSYKGEEVRVSAVRDITQRKQAEEEIKTLRGILPLCSYCKNIRDDKGYWEKVDVYIHKHSQADISHSICPECMKKHYPEEYQSFLDENE